VAPDLVALQELQDVLMSLQVALRRIRAMPDLVGEHDEGVPEGVRDPPPAMPCVDLLLDLGYQPIGRLAEGVGVAAAPPLLHGSALLSGDDGKAVHRDRLACSRWASVRAQAAQR
jgi:hypothetical protein